jgi:hypothetical protein
VRRHDLEVDGLPADALVGTRYPRSLILNLAPDLGEVVEPAARDVEELSPLLLAGDARGGMGHMDFIVFVLVVALAGEVDELENKRSAGDDAAASGEKVPADNVLEDRRLSG